MNPGKVFEANEIDLRGERINPDIFRRVGENIILKVRSEGVPSPQVVLGGDTREDTPQLMNALSRGIMNRGGSIILIGGLIAKPIAYFSTELYGADAVAYVTASHVRAGCNGVKVCFSERTKSRQPALSLAAKEVVNKHDEVIREYEQYLLKTFGPDAGQGRSLVVDSLYGTARLIAPEVLKKCMFDLESLHAFIDGKFMHLQDNAPDPTLPGNIHELRDVVKVWGGMGAAFDGDMDRVRFVDENSDVVPGDEIAMIIAQYILQNLRKKARIVYHCQSSNGLPEVIAAARGKPVIHETGWRSVKEKMEEVGAAFGSEISGHFFYGQGLYYVNNGDDGLFTTLMLSRVLQESGQSLAEARRHLPAYFTSPELRIAYDRDRNPQILEAMKKRFEKDDNFAVSKIGRDLRAEKRDGKEWCSWLVFRTSVTEPGKLSFRFEGRTLPYLADIKRALIESIPDDDQPLRDLLDQAYKSSIGDPTAYYRRALEAKGSLREQ